MDSQLPAQSPPARPSGKPRTFACPNCGGPVVLRAVGQSITATCSQCSSLIDVADENLRIIQEAQEKALTADLSIGARGKLQGKEWEVIGFQKRIDGTGDFRWTEYLLFNPYYGYRFLMDESGHWTIATMLNRDVAGAGLQRDLHDGQRSYRFFGKGMAKTIYVAGEFYWRASTSDVTTATDYIAPPYRLMVESNDEEIIVSLGEYIEAGAVAAAFKVPIEKPSSGSVGACQVNPHKGALKIGLIGLAAATAVQFASLAMAPNHRVNSQTYSLTADDKGKTLTSQDFTLKSSGNVQIETKTALDNDWLELDLSLVNTATNQTYPVSQALDHYSGSDSDDSWDEGSNQTDTLVAAVPAGTYKLLIEPDAGLFAKAPPAPPPQGLSPDILKMLRDTDSTFGQPNPQHVDTTPTLPPPAPPLPTLPVTIAVESGVPVWSNYLIALVLLFLVPIFGFIRRMLFEKSRWESGGVAEEFEGKR